MIPTAQLLSTFLVNSVFALINLAAVTYIVYMNKCQFTCIFKVCFAVFTVIFLIRSLTSGFLYFNRINKSFVPWMVPTHPLLLTINGQEGAFVITLYLMITLKTQQIYFKLMKQRGKT